MSDPTDLPPVVRAGRFELVDGRGQTRGVLSCDADTGAPTLTLRDRQGRTRITIGLAWNDMPSIQLGAEDEGARVALIARPEGHGLVIVADGEGHTTQLSPQPE